jgi:TPR repeat protein/energy-coupling factor transporter ATP-binding protein EcfA2
VLAVKPATGLDQPYPGLRAFEPGEEYLFYGREAHNEQLLSRLSENRLLAVVGASGSGKSSLVRAGLLPALYRGRLIGATSRWRICVMHPGSAPLDNLAETLAEQKALSSDKESVRKEIGRSSLGLVRAVRSEAGDFSEGESLLLFVDQFEELFRFVRERRKEDGGAEARLFVASLLEATERSTAPVYVVLTMRSDFIGDCTQFPGLPEALNRCQYLVPRLSREQVRAAIEKPLRIAGARMSPRLVERLLNELGEDTDQLPVLQHALNRTFYQWRAAGATGEVTVDHYVAAGTLEGALNAHADGLLASLGDAQPWAEKVFRCLTVIEGGRKIRRATRVDRIYEVVGAQSGSSRQHVEAVIDKFSSRENSLLLVTGKYQIADIAHESLITHWKTLDAWVEAEAKAAEWYQSAAADAAWKRRTWRDPELAITLGFLEQGVWNPAWASRLPVVKVPFEVVQEFINRGVSEQRREKEEEEGRRAKELADAHAIAEAERRAKLDAEAARAAEREARQAADANAAAQVRAKRWLITAGIFLFIAAAALALFELSRIQQRAANRIVQAQKAQLSSLTSEETFISYQLQQANQSASQKEALQRKLDQLSNEKIQLEKQVASNPIQLPPPVIAVPPQNADTVPKSDLTAAHQQISDLNEALKQSENEATQLQNRIDELQKRLLPDSSSTSKPSPPAAEALQGSPPAAAPDLDQVSTFGANPALDVPKDDPRLVEQYRKASEAGDPHATTYLGLMYDIGLGGLPKDAVKAVELYKKAAAVGDSWAMNKIGIMYQQGRGGLPKDDTKAVEFYSKAAAAGDSYAMNNLGAMYQEGRGGLALDDAKAVELYRKAADLGNPGAMVHLAFMYETGRGGLHKDKKKAKDLRQKAAQIRAGGTS